MIKNSFKNKIIIYCITALACILIILIFINLNKNKISKIHSDFIFEYLDENSDGYITKNDLVKIEFSLSGSAIKKNMSQGEKIDFFIKKFDKNFDGVLSKSEVFNYVNK